MRTRLISVFLFCLCCRPELFAQVTFNPLPTRIIGQDSAQVTNLNPNLVEGREFDTPEGIAIDTSATPPALYVSDFANNRVLGFRSATSFANGQAADIVLGQPDLVTTFPAASGTTLSTGLSNPSGIAVDPHGNVYVLDAGNNRILRFPRPFAQTAGQVPDLVIGQASFSTNGVNQGGISAATLALTATNGTTAAALQAFMAFDASGNLWVCDAGNNRVLRFNAAVLGSPASPGPAADLVLGQTDFVTGTYNPPTSNPLTSTTSFTTPTGVAFDTGGRLFVDESISGRRGRILVWNPPFYTGQPASRLLGVDTTTPQPPPISEFQLNASPGGLFPIGDAIGVADTLNSRILVFPPFAQWTSGTTFQAAFELVGQSDFSSGASNQGNPTAGAASLSLPGAATFFGSELYVADSFNNRVVVMPLDGTEFGPATRVLGQDLMTLNAPNLVEGRELNFGSSNGFDAGIAVDTNSNPPHLYVADTYNNRILGYNDLRSVKSGAKADIVIGQPDFQQVLVNYPTNSATLPNASGLFLPAGLTVDGAGNLYVADRGNGRVLRFPQPFEKYTPGTPEQADLVLGQSSFNGATIPDATDRTMAQPYGIAFNAAGQLFVSDVFLNRVLLFQGALTSGMPATMVFGQPNFHSSVPGSGPGQMNAPHHIAADDYDRLYVADSGNARLDIFSNVSTATLGQPAALTVTSGLVLPRGVYVSGLTSEIWVADPGVGAVRYPPFEQMIGAGGVPNASIMDGYGPLAVTQDAWGDLFLADAAHRVGIYYPGLGAINAANFLYPSQLAPGMIAAVFTQGNATQFGSQAMNAGSLPLPTQLNGVEVLFNGSPVPLFYAGPNQINFQVPVGAPQSGTADLQVFQPSTGRVLGDTTVAMTSVVPGFFTQAGNGIGAAAAINQDGTVNSATNPAVQGTVITLFGTGQGFISGAPPDGNISNAPLKTPQTPQFIMGTNFVPAANIQYSGLAPTLVGVWQLNVLIPDTVITTPTNPTQVVAIYTNPAGQEIPSGGGGIGRAVIIYVKAKQ